MSDYAIGRFPDRVVALHPKEERIDTILGPDGKPIVQFRSVPAAVNVLTIANAPTGSGPSIDAGTETLNLAGADVKVNGVSTRLTATVKKTANYSASANEIVPADATSGAITITFPAAPLNGTRIVVKKVDSSSNAVSLALGGSDVFNIAGGPATGSLALQNQALHAQYVSATGIWYVISTDVPLSGLDARYVRRTIATITGSATIGSAGDYVTFIGASGAPTLPTAVGNTGRYVFKNIHTATRTITTTSSQTIEALTTYTLPAGGSIELVSDGSNWRII